MITTFNIETNINDFVEEEIKILSRQEGIIKLNQLGFTNEQINELFKISTELTNK
jgi:hypothetical protein